MPSAYRPAEAARIDRAREAVRDAGLLVQGVSLTLDLRLRGDKGPVRYRAYDLHSLVRRLG